LKAKLVQKKKEEAEIKEPKEPEVLQKSEEKKPV